MKKILFAFLTLACPLLFAQEQILIVSGGDNPGLNHYSQYLQTKTLYNYLLSRYKQNAVDLYFGSGKASFISLLLLVIYINILIN